MKTDLALFIQSASPLSADAVVALDVLCDCRANVDAGRCIAQFNVATGSERALRAPVRSFCEEHGLDYGWIKNPQPLQRFGWLVFDMDSTLINIECIDELADCVGRKSEVAAITAQAMRGEDIDYDQSLIARVRLLKGLAMRDLERVYEERLRITPGARRLVEAARRGGLKTAIISGGFDYFAQRLRAELNMDVAVANHLMSQDGVLTGEIASRPVNAQVKAQTVQKLCASTGMTPDDAIVVGDGANDLNMMAIAGLSVGYRPKEVVAQKADIVIRHLPLDSLLTYVHPRVVTRFA